MTLIERYEEKRSLSFLVTSVSGKMLALIDKRNPSRFFLPPASVAIPRFFVVEIAIAVETTVPLLSICIGIHALSESLSEVVYVQI